MKQACDPKEAEDRTLPYSCYLVSYLVDGTTTYDLATTGGVVELFDYYWDLYKKDFLEFKQTEGRINPKLWVDPNAPKAKKGK
jgi:hypothetical protein